MAWNTLDWLDLVLRWFHIMGGISWIGGSLYLLWLDRIFANPERTTKGEHGEPWMIDQAGSLLVEKLKLEPDGLGKTHIWFKRETILTWVSGILLLAMIAPLPGSLLTDANGQPINVLTSTVIVIALLTLPWICWDLLWRTSQQPALRLIIFFVLLVAVAWGLAQIFSGRAVFLLLGVTLGTIMMGNVWFRVLPTLKEMKDARTENRTADEALCLLARDRTTHNSYLMFPIVVLMLSNHYPVIYSHWLNWVIAALLVTAFVGARHMVVSGKAGLWALYSALVLLGIAVYLVAAVNPSQKPVDAGSVSFTTVRSIISKHCLSCHSTVPTERKYGPAPGGVSFDRPEDIKRYAKQIKISTVNSEAMPNQPNSSMTKAERELLGRWVDGGAKLE
ncbi:MAG: urate hydroxylase PuuD [Rhodospirillaceae bacterium]|nr:urate hydroxylase PuuD [Rhodospirillaceae bacterium]